MVPRFYLVFRVRAARLCMRLRPRLAWGHAHAWRRACWGCFQKHPSIDGAMPPVGVLLVRSGNRCTRDNGPHTMCSRNSRGFISDHAAAADSSTATAWRCGTISDGVLNCLLPAGLCAQALAADPRQQAVRLFMRVWGTGEATAERWYKDGCRSLADIEARDDLTRQQARRPPSLLTEAGIS